MFERLLDAAGNAAATVRGLLFEPFDLRKWAVLALLVLLANCGSVSSNVQMNVDSNQGDLFNGARESVTPVLDALGMVGLLSIALILSTAFALIVLFIATRAEFMLLDSLQSREPRFAAWEERSSVANQVYAVRTLILAGLVALSLAVMAGVFLANVASMPFLVIGMFVLVMVVAPTVVFLEWLFVDLVPAVMMVTRTDSVSDALRWLRTLPPAELAVYVALQFGVAIGIRVIAVPIFCLCCCVAPIPGSLYVLLLPLTLWRRAFTLEWLNAHSPAA